MDKVKGFIFDIDGTLLDSNDVHAESLQFALAEAGFRFDYEYIRKLIGMGLDQILRKIIGTSVDSDVGKKIGSLKDARFKSKFAQVHAFNGAKALIQKLDELGFKLAIASSASKEDLDHFLKKLEIEPYIKRSVSSDDIEVSKPAPDAVQSALARLELDADSVYMVGDTIYDIQAAQKARVQTIAFRSGGWKDAELAHAAMIFDGPASLLDWIMDKGIKP